MIETNCDLFTHNQSRSYLNHFVILYPLRRQQPDSGQGRVISEVSRSHTVTRQSVALPWTRDWPVAEAST